MSLSIFCPSSHLMLAARGCPQCGWERPAAAGLGQPAWQPLDLERGLGGPGTAVFAMPAAADGLAVIPTRGGELVALDLATGQKRWSALPEDGLAARSLTIDRRPGKTRWLAAFSDERSLDQAGHGRLAELDPRTGRLHTLWQPQASLLSPLTLSEAFILLRTSTPELLALSRQAQPEVVWRRPLQAWWALPPVLIQPAGQDALVLAPDGQPMQGINQLRAFRLANGEPLWAKSTATLLSHPPVLAGGQLVYRDDRKTLIGREPSTGAELWRQPFKHIYSGLASDGARVYLVERGPGGEGAADYYVLQAWEIGAAPKLAWQAPLAERVRLLELTPDGVLLAGSDTGSVLAYRPGSDAALWRQAPGSKEDPIQTHLLQAGDCVLAGTYGGRVAAYRIAADETPALPEEALARGDWAQAAAAYALQGDFTRAAELYAAQPDQFTKTLALYTAGGLFVQAAGYAGRHNRNDIAIECLARAGEQSALGDKYLEMGDVFKAAQAYEQDGQLDKAAKLYEQNGDFAKARHLYKQLNDPLGVIRTLNVWRADQADIDWFETRGQFAEAALAAERAGMLPKAAQLYAQAGDREGQFRTLLALRKQQPEEWSLRELAILARQLGRYPVEAETWTFLEGSAQQAAEAYQRAAQQAIQVSPDKETLIADLFEKAALNFFETGLEEQEKSCRSQVIHYRRLPLVVVEGRTGGAFREREFNTLELVIRNLGQGVALNICVQVDSERFVVEPKNCMVNIDRLAPNTHKIENIFLQPREGQVGETVPLRLEWRWSDRHTHYTNRAHTAVPVKRLNDTSPTGAPVVIQPGGIYVNGTLVSGDQVHGDQVHGDQLHGEAQKGDKVMIQRGEKAQAKASPAEQCPNCSLPLEPGKRFCEGCGFEVKPAHPKGGRKAKDE